MRRSLCALAGVLLTLTAASAEEVTSLDTPIAKAPEFTLRNLLPRDLESRIEDGFSKKVAEGSRLKNEEATPFLVTFELTDGLLGPDAVIYTLLVSQEETLSRIFGSIHRMSTNASAGEWDTDFPDGMTCYGMVSQTLITCRIADGHLQVSATNGIGGSVDYELAKAAALDLDIEAYAAVLAAD